MAVFWDIVPCSLVHIDWCFIGAYYLHHQGGHTAQHTRKQSPLHSLRKNDISPDNSIVSELLTGTFGNYFAKSLFMNVNVCNCAIINKQFFSLQ
jgi:hypothetical protein